MATEQNNQAKEAIKNYLNQRAADDEQFAAAYAKPEKNIDECFDYVVGEARRRGNAVYMSDEEVFGLAVHYYDEDDIKINRVAGGMRVSASPRAPNVELTEEEKAAAKAEVLRKYQAEVRAEAEAKQRAAAKKPKPSPKIESPSLFDF